MFKKKEISQNLPNVAPKWHWAFGVEKWPGEKTNLLNKGKLGTT